MKRRQLTVRTLGNDSITRKALQALCESVASPRALTVAILSKYGEDRQLAELSIDPRHYLHAETFRLDYLVTSYLSKWIGLDTGIDLRGEALSSFRKAELMCSETNHLFELRKKGLFSFRPFTERVLSRARSKIANVLYGFSVKECIDNSRPGKGATFKLKGKEVRLDNKVTALDCTSACIAWAKELYLDPNRFAATFGILPEGPYSVVRRSFTSVRGNRYTTVPKNAKTDRGIAAEPSLNIELQLGAGQVLRRLLKSVAGVDLDSQTLNQDCAAHAYQYGFATIDLSMASDTVSRELVYELLPIDVAEFLDDIRSPSTMVLPDVWVDLEKWSSMGNGYTFELETLIFWAISSSVSEDIHDWAVVYGDDIIVDQSCATQLVTVLHELGFRVNSSKSFVEGSFYESCGKHYFAGEDVTPIYQKQSFQTGRFRSDEDEVYNCEAIGYRAANRIMRYCTKHRVNLYAAWGHFARIFNRHLMPLSDASGVMYDGDAGLALRADQLTDYFVREVVRTSNDASYASWWSFPSLLYIPLKIEAEHQKVYAHTLRYPQGDIPLSEGVTLRKRGRWITRSASHDVGKGTWYRNGVS
jgi:hypothetical protein